MSARRIDAKLRELEALPVTATLRRRDLLRLGAYDRVDCPDGKLLAASGELPRWVYLVIDGAVIVTMRDGRHRHFGAGSLVGDEAVLAKQSYPYTAMAAGRARLLVIPATHFESLVAEIPALTATVVHSLSARLIAAETSHGLARRRLITRTRGATFEVPA